MSTQDNNRIGLFIAIPCYFVLLICCAAYANRKNKKRHGGEDELTSHYLGGRDFGPWLLPGTMLAGWFSGYTIVGVPNESYMTGWLALRWLNGTIGVIVVLAAVSPRIQKAGFVRNHQSSLDFLTDRYRSQLLRYAGFILQVFPSLIFLAGQCTAIKSSFNSIFGIDPDSVVALLVICALILVFEFVGGLTSVALTDAIQAGLMIICFTLLSLLVKVQYGGWTDLNWETYPKPEHYQTPTNDAALQFWSFEIVVSSLFTLPSFFMRTYAARSPRSVKAGFMLLATGPFCLMLPAIFVGTMSVQIIADEGFEVVTSPFAAFLEALMSIGGFSNFVAVITYTASLAAIMSTADSTLIGISHLIAVEIIYPIMPNVSPKHLKYIGGICSVVSMTAAILISIFGGSNISDLASIQFSLSMQIAPAFLIGLFVTERYDCHPFSIFAGAVAGFIATFCMHFISVKESYAGYNIDSGIGGFIANVGIIVMSECLHRVILKKRGTVSSSIDNQINDTDQDQMNEENKPQPYIMQPSWDIPSVKRFGDVPLTSSLMWEMMMGIREPFTQSWAWTILWLLLSVASSPFGVGMIPPLTDDGTLAYAPSVIRGIPNWAFSIIMYSIFATAILVGIIWLYPDDFPSVDETDTAVNPHTLSLSKVEMSKRSVYDAPNEDAGRRRSSLLIQRKTVKASDDVKEDEFQDDGGVDS